MESVENQKVSHPSHSPWIPQGGLHIFTALIIFKLIFNFKNQKLMIRKAHTKKTQGGPTYELLNSSTFGRKII
jgi:hypothetical protein